MRNLLCLFVACSSGDPYAALGLGFESAALEGWAIEDVEVQTVDDVRRSGSRSLRMDTSGYDLGTASVSLDARPLAGKRLRVSGWIQTAGVLGGASLRVRTDGAQDDMADRRLQGTVDWTEVTAEVTVPAGAETAVLGPLLVGPGTAWFDDLRIEVLEPPRIVLAGTVTDPDGAPAAGAEVALIGEGEIVAHVEASGHGRFQFDTEPGRWGLSAHRAGAVGAFLDPRSFVADQHDLQITLGRDSGVTVRGTTTPRVEGSWVQIAPLSQHHGDLFAVPLADDGTFEALLPRGDRYIVSMLQGANGDGIFPRVGEVVEVTLPVVALAPPPAEVVGYIAERGVALATTEPGSDLGDLEPLGELIGEARVVALGEATHGTREFFQLKHRLLEYLVAEHGFTVFALEANQPECRALDDYVLHGKGDARRALAGIYAEVWQTEELLALIEWMRAWNADPQHAAKVRFAGYDMQASPVAYATVAAFVRQHAPRHAEAMLAPLVVLGEPSGHTSVARATAEERARIAAGFDTLGEWFDARPGVPADVRHDLAVLEQAYRLYAADETEASAIRDRAMADNLGWWMAQQPGARLVVWAHNGHISNTLEAFPNMGSHLRRELGASYLNVGFVFGEGGFQTRSASSDATGLEAFTVGAPPESNASVAFSRTGKPLLVLDLRALPTHGPVPEWFATPHPVREIGAVYTSEKAMTTMMVLPALYDAVIYVDRTTRARPLHLLSGEATCRGCTIRSP
jgi:erythromycin esterase